MKASIAAARIAIDQAVKEAKELDRALTRLEKTFDAVDTEHRQLAKRLKTANDYKRSK